MLLSGWLAIPPNLFHHALAYGLPFPCVFLCKHYPSLRSQTNVTSYVQPSQTISSISANIPLPATPPPHPLNQKLSPLSALPRHGAHRSQSTLHILLYCVLCETMVCSTYYSHYATITRPILTITDNECFRIKEHVRLYLPPQLCPNPRCTPHLPRHWSAHLQKLISALSVWLGAETLGQT